MKVSILEVNKTLEGLMTVLSKYQTSEKGSLINKNDKVKSIKAKILAVFKVLYKEKLHTKFTIGNSYFFLKRGEKGTLNLEVKNGKVTKYDKLDSHKVIHLFTEALYEETSKDPDLKEFNRHVVAVWMAIESNSDLLKLKGLITDEVNDFNTEERTYSFIDTKVALAKDDRYTRLYATIITLIIHSELEVNSSPIVKDMNYSVELVSRVFGDLTESIFKLFNKLLKD